MAANHTLFDASNTDIPVKSLSKESAEQCLNYRTVVLKERNPWKA